MFWMLALGEVTVGGKPFKTEVGRVMLDTGTSLNLMPDKDFGRLM